MANNIPLYMKIMEYLKKKIIEREILPDEKLPTEQELAELFNVSRITSKRALVELEREGLIYRVRGSGSFVSPESDEKGTLHIDSKLVAMVLPFASTMGRIMDTIRGATEYLSRQGYYLSVHSTGRDVKKEKEMIEELVDKNIAGIIYYPLSDKYNLDLINNLYLDKYPIVTIDKMFESVPISYVISDNFSAGHRATEYLIDNGHQKIGYISGVAIEDVVSVRQRYFGYCRALKKNDIPIDNSIIKLGIGKNLGFSKLNDETRKEIINIIKNYRKKGVTAIYTENDYVAINIIRICKDIGITVPGQLSIIGFDNIEMADNISVPLTTLEQDFEQIGKKASEIIVKSLRQHQYDYEQITLPVKLIERQSTTAITESKEEIS